MCFGRRDKVEADAIRSRELDKAIRADEKKMQKEVKLLLLGTNCQLPLFGMVCVGLPLAIDGPS